MLFIAPHALIGICQSNIHKHMHIDLQQAHSAAHPMIYSADGFGNALACIKRLGCIRATGWLDWEIAWLCSGIGFFCEIQSIQQKPLCIIDFHAFNNTK